MNLDTIEWKSMLFVVVVLFVSLVGIKLIDKIKPINGELKRKSFHVINGIVMLTFPYIFSNPVSVGILGAIAIAVMLVLRNTGLKKTLGSALFSVERKSWGEIFFIISVFLIFVLSKGDPVYYSIPILILTFADSTAALIGKRYSKGNLAKNNEDSKSIEGSFAFFVVAFMATLIPTLLYTNTGREETLYISLIIGFVIALVEMIAHTGNDNLLIPLLAFTFYSNLMNLDLHALKYNCLILGILFLMSRIIYGVKALSKLSLVEAIVVGYLAIVLYGWYALIPPLLLLATVMIFPMRNKNEQNTVYDARIIETNILIGTGICVVVALFGMKEEFFMIYATCYAMHLAVNTFVRVKYFHGWSNLKSSIFGFFKSLLFVLLPGIALQYIAFKKIIDIPLLVVAIGCIIGSLIVIYFAKKKVRKEENSIENGIMHAEIVFIFTVLMTTFKMWQIGMFN